jgi:hypothetical protein
MTDLRLKLPLGRGYAATKVHTEHVGLGPGMWRSSRCSQAARQKLNMNSVIHPPRTLAALHYAARQRTSTNVLPSHEQAVQFVQQVV